MSEINSLNKKYFTLIMKSIQNEIKDTIIDKFILKIINQNIIINKLKNKCEKLEKISSKCLKKLLSKNEKYNELIDLNISNDFLYSNINSSQFFTITSDLDSTNLTSNFSPKVSTIECKKITFKKKDSFDKNEKNKKKINHINNQKYTNNNINQYKNNELNSPFLKRKKSICINKNKNFKIDIMNTEINIKKNNNIIKEKIKIK